MIMRALLHVLFLRGTGWGGERRVRLFLEGLRCWFRCHKGYWIYQRIMSRSFFHCYTCTQTIEPFTSDGCSGGMSWLWRTVLRRPPPWEGACIEHDRAYWAGGTAEDRLNADLQLAARVYDAGASMLFALLVHFAVRIGGHPLLPLPWRWGYGWKYPRGYN